RTRCTAWSSAAASCARLQTAARGSSASADYLRAACAREQLPACVGQVGCAEGDAARSFDDTRLGAQRARACRAEELDVQVRGQESRAAGGRVGARPAHGGAERRPPHAAVDDPGVARVRERVLLAGFPLDHGALAAGVDEPVAECAPDMWAVGPEGLP